MRGMILSDHKIIHKTYNLLFVSTSYPTNAEDWRGVFISQLAHALANEPDLNLRIMAPPGDFPGNSVYVCGENESEWLRLLMSLGGIAHIYRQGGMNSIIYSLRLLKLLRNVYAREEHNIDVMHVNWLQNIVPLPVGRTPLLVTVLGTDLKLLALPGMKFMLRHALKGRRSIIAPNAEWMVPILRQALPDECEIRHINFGIDERWYEVERTAQCVARKWVVVLRVTNKKIGSLIRWGANLFNGKEDKLHLFGPMQEQVDIPDWIVYHGPVGPKELRDIWFPEAAGLITLSEHDEGRPQVILEAMAASLPAIVSAIDAHKSLIQHQKTGWLCSNEEDFVDAINALSEKELNIRIGRQAREWMRANVGTWGDCAHRYKQAYEDLMGRDN